MLGSILQLQDLRTVTGYERQSDIERCLRDQGIRYFYGRPGELWTTLELINAAGGLGQSAANSAAYPADMFG